MCEKLPIGGELCKAKLVPLASQIAGRLATASATAVCLDIQWCSATDDVLATFQPTNMIAPAVDVPKVVLVKNIECSSCKVRRRTFLVFFTPNASTAFSSLSPCLRDASSPSFPFHFFVLFLFSFPFSGLLHFASPRILH